MGFRIIAFDQGRRKRFLAAVTAVSVALLGGYAFLDRPQVARAEDNAQQPDLRFTILHTNDLHAHDQSFSENGKLVGGMARIGHVIRQLRAKDGDTVTIDAGDVFQGTPLYNLKHGEIEVNLLNMIGCDIAAIGNHEFDDGPNNLAEQLRKAKYQVVCCNLDFSAVPALAELVKPSVVKVIHGEKVGFIGATTPEITRGSITLGGVTVKPSRMLPTSVITDEVARLQAEGINKIVVVSHCGIEYDQKLARQSLGIDVIVGGHSHTRIDPPIIVDHTDGSSTMIVQTGCYGRAVGELSLAFDSSGRLLKDQSHERLIDITDKVPEDPDLKAYIEEQAKPLKALENQVIGHALGSYSLAFNNYLWDSPIGDLVCDALFEEAQKFGATIVLQNRGGIRSHIEAGPITANDAESVLPFDESLVVATISGDCLLHSIENGLSGYLGARFLEVHGIKFAYDPSKLPGKKVVFAECQNDLGHWTSVEPTGNYRVGINSYNFKSGEGHDFSKATAVMFCEGRLSSVFEAYLKDHKEVKPGVPDRIVPLNPTIKIDVASSNGKVKVRVSGVDSGSNLTLVVGNDHSVECIEGPTPVPVSQPHILRSNAVSTKDGTYEWTLDRDEIKSFSSDGSHSDLDLCVIARHGSGPHDTAISYPKTSLGI